MLTQGNALSKVYYIFFLIWFFLKHIWNEILFFIKRIELKMFYFIGTFGTVNKNIYILFKSYSYPKIKTSFYVNVYLF